jgi:hypothetical protein
MPVLKKSSVPAQAKIRVAVPLQSSRLNFLSCAAPVCYNLCVRRILWTVFILWLCGLVVAARADTFSLADGTSLTGDIVSFDDIGVKFRLTDGTYSDRVSWTKFSQDGLKQLSANPKIKPLVEPFLEIPPSERPQKPEVKIQDVTRLERPPHQALLGALFSSSVGLFALLLIYAANIYAGFEIAVVRARPKALVMGVAAVLPILGPIIFLAIPMHVDAAPVEAPAEGDPATFAVAGQTPVPDEISVAATGAAPPAAAKTAAQVFQRGQFTFNRRFFETKFSGFFGPVRHGADKDLVLLVKTGGGQFAVERITRIATSDVHLEAVVGGARQEFMVPFSDIQEVQLKPRET